MVRGSTNCNIDGKDVNLKTTALKEFFGKPSSYLIKSITMLRRGCLNGDSTPYNTFSIHLQHQISHPYSKAGTVRRSNPLISACGSAPNPTLAKAPLIANIPFWKSSLQGKKCPVFVIFNPKNLNSDTGLIRRWPSYMD
jgi:hypothetical protein